VNSMKLKQANPYQAVPPPSLSFGPEGFTGPKFSGLGVTRLPQAGESLSGCASTLTVFRSGGLHRPEVLWAGRDPLTPSRR